VFEHVVPNAQEHGGSRCLENIEKWKGFQMKMSKGVLGLTLAVSLAGLILGGCSNKKKQADLAMQESTELRERIATLDQGNREKDSRIAELETRLAECGTTQITQAPIQQPSTVAYPTPTGGGSSGWSEPSGDSGFVQTGRDEVTATIAGNLLFDSGRATIKESAKRQLDRIAGELNKKYRGGAIRIEGHTDSDKITKSKWASNDALSQARADAVKQYLSTKGVSTSRISSIGYGSSQPKSTKAASRRVEIVVTK
jgi:chemotaxis protein MotB